jgi:tRNA 2-thiouridine synthesizing protein A
MVDARGYSCPIPVVMTQREIERTKPDTLEVMVDNQAAVQNIKRFATARGYAVAVAEQGGGDFLLTLSRA